MKDLFPAKLAVKHLFVLAERVSQFYTENLQRLVSALLGDEAQIKFNKAHSFSSPTFN